MIRFQLIAFFIFLLFGNALLCQNIALYEQFNGRYDFTFIGKSMNTNENGFTEENVTQTSSSTILNLNTENTIEKAYLYWSGSGDGDFEISLNNLPITAERQFAYSRNSNNLSLSYFGAFADVTEIVQNTGNGIYNVSELDISEFEEIHRISRRTNYAGWAILIVYSNPDLPMNQINIYDGFEALAVDFEGQIDSIEIALDNLNVLDNQGSKIAFLAWEGDVTLDINESLKINNNTLSNHINPSINAFNSTNSFANESDLYNMDIDVYDIQNNINIGDSQALIEITTGRDFVLINTIVTKLNNQLPDATVIINSIESTCNSSVITVDYTVSNRNSTEILQAGIPISFYINNQYVNYSETTLPIEINGNWHEQINLTIPEVISEPYTLKIIVDEYENGQGIATELNELNNDFQLPFELLKSPIVPNLNTIFNCLNATNKVEFDLTNHLNILENNGENEVKFYENYSNALNHENHIINESNYTFEGNYKEIFALISNDTCFTITSFFLEVKKCKPIVYNYISSNSDGSNDSLIIDGLKNIFLNYELEIYNRWGKLIWQGKHHENLWNGYVKHGFQNNQAPDGTYFYVLKLNDQEYPNPLTGFLYLNH